MLFILLLGDFLPAGLIVISLIPIPYAKRGHTVCKGSFDTSPGSWQVFSPRFLEGYSADFHLELHVQNYLAICVHPGQVISQAVGSGGRW